MSAARKAQPYVREPSGVLRLNKSYNFVDKRESVDELRTMIDDSGLSWKQVHEASGVGLSTLHNWFLGRTLRPQSTTLNAVGRVFGKRLGWVDAK
jgi:hypothetical protein